MRVLNGLFLLLTLSAALAANEKQGESRPSVIGRRISGFVLPDPGGKSVGLADFKDARATLVVFLGTRCPISNAYVPILLEIEKSYRDKGVRVLGIYANPGDSAEAVTRHVKDYKIGFPVLLDARQGVQPLFGARRLSEAFVLDGRQVVRYAGRIDDRFGNGYKRDEPHRRDLCEALDEVLAGKQVTTATTEPAGCLITKAARPREVTYAKHVAPILHKRCADCHHPGTAAPFPLLTYEDASANAAMIAEVVSLRQMPPWQADPRFGHFANERRLSQDEIDMLTAWVDAGAPEGDKKAAPPAPRFADGWRIGKPDVVFRMPQEFTVPAKGKIEYKYFITKTDFKEDMWLQAAEARPGNSAVVHHIIVFYRDTRPGASKEPIWVTATAPGAEPVILPEGLGRKIPAGAELVWQMHYTSNGKEEKDRSEVGLVFCKKPPSHNVRTIGAENRRLKIPAGDANCEIVSQLPVLKDAVVLNLFPHMHLRGKDFEYQVMYPDGQKQTLLLVPQFDFNWQNTYRLQKPLHLPKGSTVRCIAHYDNSAANPANPDPTKEVRWGDQTWEEMMIGYVDFYWEDDAAPKNE
jgi:hypothetical protein